MNQSLRLYCAQINSTVGDFKANYEKISFHINKAKAFEADLIAFPELAITGYPPEDLLLKPAFIEKNIEYLEKVKSLSDNIVIILGFVNKDIEIYNSAAILSQQKIVSIYNKQYLPNYSVFDEERYFRKGANTYIYQINDTVAAVNICEDIYYSSGPLQSQAILGGSTLIINISASPYHIGKIEEREKLLFTRAVDNRTNILYVNLVGGQDELVFDGSSMLISDQGKILCRAKSFEEDFFIYDLDVKNLNSTRLQDAKYRNQRQNMLSKSNDIQFERIVVPAKIKKRTKKLNETKHQSRESITSKEEEVLNALVLGTKDYIFKNRFKKVLLGLSGGIDSALTAVIAVFAVGAKNVTGVMMPSVFSSDGSIRDSEELASNLGINIYTAPIHDIYTAYLDNIGKHLKDSKINITRENLQARIRGNILMGLSNEYNWLLLSTGNKSEISVGYCTLYGDMAGGFSPIKDIYKMMVYSLSVFINKKFGNIIPESIISKPPSAELRPDQKDQDSLPPYEMLDSILKAYIEEEKDYDEIVRLGFDKEIVKDIINMVDFSEYKRRQGSPGIKITSKAFGRDRRYPITNRFRTV